MASLFTLNPVIQEAFTSSPPPRSIFLTISESTVSLVSSNPSTSAPISSQFDSIASSLPSNNGQTVLFNLTSDAGSPAEWLLISWVPDLTPVRNKMLYSSSRMEIKKSLGIGQFVQNDLFASETGEITWESYQGTLGDDGKCLNEKELAQVETKMGNMTASTAATSAMGHVPFNLGNEAKKQVEAFAAGNCKLVSLSLSGGEGSIGLTPGVDNSKYTTVGGSIAAILATDTPSFVLLKTPGAIVGATQNTFLYSCPEGASIKLKMSHRYVVMFCGRDFTSMNVMLTNLIHNFLVLQSFLRSFSVSFPSFGPPFLAL